MGRTRDLIVVGGTALVTAVVALAFFAPIPIATGDRSPEASATPALMCGAVRLTLVVGQANYLPGEKPIITLRAENTGDQPAEIQAQVDMMTTRPVSPMSRMAVMPTKVWSSPGQAALEGQGQVSAGAASDVGKKSAPFTISLKPKEVVAFEWQTGVAVQAGNAVSFIIRAGGQSMTAASITVSVPSGAAGTNNLSSGAAGANNLTPAAAVSNNGVSNNAALTNKGVSNNAALTKPQ